MHRFRDLCFVPLLMLGIACGKSAPVATRTAPPKLLVLVVFDQMRGDYLARWADQFGIGGFCRLCTEGTWFTDCHYPFATTTTGPGHASLLTGCSPDRHGIVTNNWLDRSTGKMVYCAATERTQFVYTVPPPPPEPNKSPKYGGSPERLLAPTVGDALKTANDATKVVAISLKDRSACLPGGLKPDACYWFDNRTGTFVTSTYYRDKAHDWVADFNARKPTDRWLGKHWERLRPDLDYEKRSGPDDVAMETTGFSRRLGRVFPHPLSMGKVKPDKEYYEEVVCSPFGNDLLLDFAKIAIAGTQLGQGSATDLLSISFSSTDAVGHAYGPDSQEVMDVTLRADRLVAKLLSFLDEKVGQGQYLVALTSDHGICRIPELSAAKGIGAQRIESKLLFPAIEEFLDGKYGIVKDESSKWLDGEAFPWFFLNYRKIAGRKLEPAAVADALAGWLRNQPWAAAIYTQAQLEQPAPAGDPYFTMMKKGNYPARAGDVALVIKPYSFLSVIAMATDHGSPHAYDTHVPLVFFGPGMPAAKSAERVTPQAIAAVFARAAGIAPPALADAAVPNQISGVRLPQVR